jgi:hypothetical protein
MVGRNPTNFQHCDSPSLPATGRIKIGYFVCLLEKDLNLSVEFVCYFGVFG